MKYGFPLIIFFYFPGIQGGAKPGSGFKANFKFETEYLIPVGTPAPDGSCKFTYRSSSRKDGRFNSPRHPSNYPSETNCIYEFYALPHEQVQIVFDSFKVRAENLPSIGKCMIWQKNRNGYFRAELPTL